MIQDNKAKIESAVLTVLLMLLILLGMAYIYIEAVPEEEDEGIEVSLGTGDTGGGIPEGMLSAASQPQPTTAPPASSAPSDNDLLTQEDESVAQLRQEQEKQKKAREAELAEQRRREAEQKAKEKAEQEAREKALAEQRAKEQAAIDKANQLGSLFGQTDSPEGGNGTDRQSASTDTKGNPLGHGSSGGNTWSLNGRGLKGSLPKPSTSFNQEGTVIVSIQVDKEGNVISARVNGGTISDEATRQLAVKAAKQAKFTATDRPDKQVGTITYHFKFK